MQDASEIRQRFAPDPRLENRPWASNYPRQRSFAEINPPPLHDDRPPPVIPDQDPINTAISRLSLEAINEIERVAEVGGLQRDDIKHSAWNILSLLRDVIREQFHRSGARVEPRDPVRMSPSVTGQAVQLNNSIMSIALDARKNIQNLALNAPNVEKRSILEGLHPAQRKTARMMYDVHVGLLNSYRRLLDGEAQLINDVHLITMLHRIVSVANRVKQNVWIIDRHHGLIRRLLEKVCSSIGDFMVIQFV